MLVEEYLMVRFMEELSELQHATSKCIRFGPRHICRVHGIPNIEKVKNEYEDVLAISAVLEHFGVKFRPNDEECRKKVDKVIEDLNKALEKGTVEEEKKSVSG